MTMTSHPCFNCPAQAVDHAIICPFLGVIASGRCKSIRRKPDDEAFQRLHGWAVTPNRRKMVRLRSGYWKHQSSIPTVAYNDALFGLMLWYPLRGVGSAQKANRAGLDSGRSGKRGGNKEGTAGPGSSGRSLNPTNQKAG